MKSLSRRLRLLLLTLAPVVVFVACFGWLTYRHVRQARLDNALIEAVAQDDISDAGRLLDQGADPNARARRKQPHASLQELLLECFGHAHAPTGLTALQLAMATPHPDSEPSSHYTIALALLQHGADPNLCGYSESQAAHDVWPKGWTPLMQAAADRNVPPQVMEALLAHGAKVDVRDARGRTALMIAAGRGNKTVASRLVDAGADVNARDKDAWTAIMWACASEATEIVPLLLAHGADVNARDQGGWSTLMIAANREDRESIRLLLDAGAKANVRNQDGETALDQTRAEYPKSKKILHDIITLLRQRGAHYGAKE